MSDLSSPSHWPLGKWGKILIGVGGVVIIGGTIFFLTTRRVKIHKDVPGNGKIAKSNQKTKNGKHSLNQLAVEMKLANIDADEQQALISALTGLQNTEEFEDSIHSLQLLSQDKLLHQYIDNGGGLEKLLKIISEHDVENSQSVLILRTIANLCQNKKIREEIQLGNISDVLRYLISSNAEVVEQALRVLMNLSASKMMESKIGRLGGLVPLITILQESSSDPAVQLLTLRVLVNLLYHDDNKTIGIQKGLIATAIKLFSEKPDEEIATRLCRILGSLSVNTGSEAYNQIATPDVAKTFVKTMKRFQLSENLGEQVAINVSKIIDQTESDYQEQADTFKKIFVQEKENFAVEALVKLLTSSRTSVIFNSLHLLLQLVEGVTSDTVIKTINGVDGANAIKALATSDHKEKITEQASRLLIALSLDSVD